MYGIKYILKKEFLCVIGLVMFYGSRTKNSMKVCMLLSCALYYLINNYVCIDYIGCQSKTLSVICYDKICADMNSNEFLRIEILEFLMNLMSCHGFTKDINSTVIVSFRNWSVEYHLEKEFVIIEHNSNTLSSVPSEMKQIIRATNMHNSDFVMSCFTPVPSIENIIKKLHIMSDENFGYIHNLYHDKQV